MTSDDYYNSYVV